MSFNNAQLHDSDLPEIESVDYTRVDPRYPLLVAAIMALTNVVALTGLILALRHQGNFDALNVFGGQLAAIAVPLLLTAAAYAYAKSYRYALREHDLLLRKGIFWETEIAQPLVRLQHVELHRGPLEKALGLAKLKVFSAGSGRETFAIPGLPLRTAARMRRFVLAHQRD